MATHLQIYITATAITSILWMIYVCWKTFPPHSSTWLSRERPMLRHTLTAIWVTSVLDLFAMVFITMVVLIRNYYGLGTVLAEAPSYLSVLLFFQYAVFYVVGITPATVLFVAIMSIRKVEVVRLEGEAEALKSD